MTGKSPEEIFKEYQSGEEGLSNEEAYKRLNTYGFNEIKEAKKKSAWRIFLSQFNDLMIIILLIVAVFMGIYGYFYSHEYTDTIVIIIVVLLNAIMGFLQEQKAEVTLEGLKKYATITCKVKRAGEITYVNAKEIVPGDLIILEAGDTVPADARILEEANASVDEATLTGESIAVKKTSEILKENLSIQESKNMVFSGTNVTNGKMVAIVTKTGMDTELGSIAKSLNTPYEVKPPLAIKIEEISRTLTKIIFFILLFVFLYGVMKGYQALEIIMLCISLAVAVIPEGLPAVITISLSNGAGELAKKKTIVRTMSAVETLGATDIICSDKTGTITQNKMKVMESVLFDETIFSYIAALDNDVIFKKREFLGDPTETSLCSFLESKGIDVRKWNDKYKRILSAPFDSERKRMSTLNKIDKQELILVKGSVENLLAVSSFVKEEGKIIRLNEKKRKEILALEQNMASNALRVLGFAYKENDKKITSSLDLLEEEKELIFVGLVGIIDPPRESVKKSVAKCLTAGIRPVMITGDSLVTACAIAKEVGIITSNEEGILGSELDQYSDKEMQELVKKYNVYARVSPEHKRRIVAAWQANGKVVAMTGDGVNDAPAIKDAHVGIGMGVTGTEVTKSVADVILLDDSFSTIVDAVEEGRRIYANIRNNLVYSLSSNFAELFVVLIGMFTGNTLLAPIHILFIDLVTDSIPSVCLSFENSSKGLMREQPRGIDTPIFTPFIKAHIFYSAVIETFAVLVTFFISLQYFSASTAGSLALFSMVVQELLYAFVCRDLKEPIYKQGFFSNRYMNIGILGIIVIEALVFLTPVGHLVKVETLAASTIGIVLLGNIITFFLYEGIKPFIRRFFNDKKTQ